jgi:hypothetical protein
MQIVISYETLVNIYQIIEHGITFQEIAIFRTHQQNKNAEALLQASKKEGLGVNKGKTK